MPTPQLSPATSARFQSLYVEPPAKNQAFVPENIGNCPGPTRWPSNASLSSIASSLSARTDLAGDGVNRAAHHALLARSNPRDNAPPPAGPCAAHVLAVGTSLAPLLNEWGTLDARVAAARNTAGGALQVSDLYDPQQIRAALSPGETHTRAVLGNLEVHADIISAVLDSERSAGGRAIMDACRLLSMPEVRGQEQVKTGLEHALRCYIKRADGDYSGTYKALGHHAHEEYKALAACIKESVARIGPQQVRDRLLKDMAPGILDTMARKNPGVCAGELRGRLAELLNVQSFSGYKALLDGASGANLLRVAELLPNFIESAEKPARPPANDRDAAPPVPVRPVADPIADVARILKALQGVLPPITVGNIGNNNGNNNGFRGKNFGNAKIEGQTMPLRSEPAFERLAARVEQPDDQPVVQTQQRAVVQVPVTEEEHIEQTTTEEVSSPPPPPPLPPGDPIPPVRGNYRSTPLDELKKAHDPLIKQLAEMQKNGGIRLRPIKEVGSDRFRKDMEAAAAASSSERDETHLQSDVPYVAYSGKSTQYLNTINQYMKAPIKPGATTDSTFLFFGESTRNNVQQAEAIDGTPATEGTDPSSSGPSSPTTLGKVTAAWDAKQIRDRFGAIGVPTPTPIPERSASTPQ